jgi:stearoyl-CoA desaturase (Delta-9 desaturase)
MSPALVVDRPPASRMQVAPTRDVPAAQEPRLPRSALAVTTLIVVAPALALALAVWHLWGHGIAPRDVTLAVLLYIVLGHGVSAGYHRLFAHRSFTANRALKIALAVAGSMTFQGGVIGWVADHRRHHAFADRPGDPHSPHDADLGAFRGLWHAHVGWLFRHTSTSCSRYAPDLLADRDLVVLNRLFPLWCVVSLMLPAGVGWLLGGLAGALTALIWAGGVRIFVLHHTTWSVNSLCHMFGRRPFAVRDRSTNVFLLSALTFGESWHNNHHAFPRSARHGLLPHQWDSSARLIRTFERAGWATDVRHAALERAPRRADGVVAGG